MQRQEGRCGGRRADAQRMGGQRGGGEAHALLQVGLEWQQRKRENRMRHERRAAAASGRGLQPRRPQPRKQVTILRQGGGRCVPAEHRLPALQPDVKRVGAVLHLRACGGGGRGRGQHVCAKWRKVPQVVLLAAAEHPGVNRTTASARSRSRSCSRAPPRHQHAMLPSATRAAGPGQPASQAAHLHTIHHDAFKLLLHCGAKIKEVAGPVE